jgi:hypothetical protein
VRKSWIIKTQLFAFYLFFFKTGGLVWRKTRQKSEIKHQVLPLPLALAWAFCPKKKRGRRGLWWCGGFGALRTNKI